ncbi:MAG: colicin E3/pyocin S6 family cytotoxin [Acidaminobacteraceae bacterium]
MHQIIPKPSYLDNHEYYKVIDGRKAWISKDRKRIYTWDTLHGEIEVFNSRGMHLAVLHPITGKQIKSAVNGRRLNVK